jgi:hypothetical protein
VTYREHVVRGNVRSEHVVQLFDSIESLADCVSAFLAAAYEAGDGLLVVVKPKHWNAIAQGLGSLGCDLPKALRSGRITVLDAAATLRAISRNEMPDKDRFNDVVGKVIRKLAAQGRIAIYGEMVELLAEEANFTAALHLEELWNGLAEQTSFSLMCGYSSAHFGALPTAERLEEICRAHKHVRTADADPLAGWLLQRTGLPFRTDPLSVRP